jgi:hypothetical protein
MRDCPAVYRRVYFRISIVVVPSSERAKYPGIKCREWIAVIGCFFLEPVTLLGGREHCHAGLETLFDVGRNADPLPFAPVDIIYLIFLVEVIVVLLHIQSVVLGAGKQLVIDRRVREYAFKFCGHERHLFLGHMRRVKLDPELHHGQSRVEKVHKVPKSLGNRLTFFQLSHKVAKVLFGILGFLSRHSFISTDVFIGIGNLGGVPVPFPSPDIDRISGGQFCFFDLSPLKAFVVNSIFLV